MEALVVRETEVSRLMRRKSQSLRDRGFHSLLNKGTTFLGDRGLAIYETEVSLLQEKPHSLQGRGLVLHGIEASLFTRHKSGSLQ